MAKKITSNLIPLVKPQKSHLPPITKAAQAQAIKDEGINYMMWFLKATQDISMLLPAQYLNDFNSVRTKVLEKLQDSNLKPIPLTHKNLIFGLLTNTEPSIIEIKNTFTFDLPQSEVFLAFIKSTLVIKKSLRVNHFKNAKRLKAHYPLFLKDVTSSQDALKALDKMFIQYYLKILYPYSH